MTRLLPLLMAAAACGCTSNTVVFPHPNQVQSTSGPVRYTAIAGREGRVAMAMSLNADCTPSGIPTIRVPNPPAHGTTAIRPGNYYPNYGQQTQRATCDLKPEPGVALFYQPAEGYLGPDTLLIEIIYPDGTDRTTSLALTVK